MASGRALLTADITTVCVARSLLVTDKQTNGWTTASLKAPFNTMWVKVS